MSTISYKQIQAKINDAHKSKRKLMDISRALPSLTMNDLMKIDELVNKEIRTRCKKNDVLSEQLFGER